MRTPTFLQSTGAALLLALVATACNQSQPTAYVHDDVYDRPDPRAITASVSNEPLAEEAAPRQEDYYDPQVAPQYSNPRGYYDMAYNDPYYYGYDRYGFGMMYGNNWGYNGWNNGWNDPWNDPWGYGYGYGSNWGCSGYGSGWQMGYGYGWPNNGGCGGYGWSNNYWNSGPYYGYGYYGYGGGCYSCYQPIVNGWNEGWNSNLYYGHRPRFGGGSGNGAGGSAPVPMTRVNPRDQIGLMRPATARPNTQMSNGTTRPLVQPDARPTTRPTTPPVERPVTRPAVRERGRGTDTAPQRHDGGGFDRGTAPSRDTGGGSGGGGGRRPR